MQSCRVFALLALSFLISAGCASQRSATPAKPAETAASDIARLFPLDGVPVGWSVRTWNDVAQSAAADAQWTVRDGILRGSNPRGTWLVSDQEYGDFVLEFEFRLGERGNSGVGLRFPPSGDPAFDGLELQMVDARYYGTNYSAQPWELTGGLYKAVPPEQQVYKPQEWNRYSITCRGPRVAVTLNGVTVLNVDLDQQTQALERGRPLAERPRRGRIGFQELSRGGGQVEIRDARIRKLE